MSTNGKLRGRHVAILAADGFELVELVVPLFALRRADRVGFESSRRRCRPSNIPMMRSRRDGLLARSTRRCSQHGLHRVDSRYRADYIPGKADIDLLWCGSETPAVDEPLRYLYRRARVDAGCTLFRSEFCRSSVENTPERTLSIATEYRRTSWLAGVSVNGAAYYISARAIDSLNQAFIPGYTLFDLGGAYRGTLATHEITLRVTAQNVAGKRYLSSTGANYLAQGPPGLVKLSVTARF